MSPDSKLYYSSASPALRTTPTYRTVRIGAIVPEGNRQRVVLYTTEQLHLDAVDNDSPNNETMFHHSAYDGLRAVSGEASATTLEAVDQLAHYTSHAFHRQKGISIAMSDNPAFASKIVFYMTAGSVDSACAMLAILLGGPEATYEIELLYSDNMSEMESQRELEFAALDFDPI